MRSAVSTFGLSALAAFSVLGCSSSNPGMMSTSSPSTGVSGGAGSVTPPSGASGSGAAGLTGVTPPASTAGRGAAGVMAPVPPASAGTGAAAGMGSPSTSGGSGTAGGSGGAAVSGAGGSSASAGKSGGTAGSSGATALMAVPVPLPNGNGGIGFDDMRYSPELKKVIVPAGRTGDLDLVDPATNEVTVISGFSSTMMFTLGKHRSGSTSADYGAGKIYAIDNDTKTVRVVDPATTMITFSTMLAAAPDYIRWVETTHEIWVTMPQNPGVSVINPEIEVLTVADNAAPVHAANITFPATGPEALFIDDKRGRAYTNNGFGGNTYSVDLKTRMVAETWKNGCTALTVDLEFDDARGFLMVACAAGRVAVLDTANGGKQLGEVSTGMGVDVCAYNSTLHHMYLAGQDSKDLSVIGISAAGASTVLGKLATAAGSQMVASDDFGNAWVGDPGGGRLLKVQDIYPATP